MMNRLQNISHSKARYAVVALVGFVMAGIFLLFANSGGGFGFPLDDAWIHQTYARNLVRNGRLEFVPGIVSSGSTSPLWTLLLALGYLLRLPYLWWAYLLGIGSLCWLSWSGMRLWRQIWPALAEKDWIAGVVLVMTWPFLWAAVSGMETIFFVALGLAIVTVYYSATSGNQISYRQIATLGVLSGLLILIRPDGVFLIVLVGLAVLLLPGSWMARLKSALVFGGTAVIILIPYFLFNWVSSGTLWPNTFYAKQTEYASLLTVPLLHRFAQLLFFSLGGPAVGIRGMSGPHLLLLPGLVFAAWKAVQVDWSQRKLAVMLPLLWAGGHIFLYAWRLPLAFQHGRYLLAAFPIWILFGLAGWQMMLFSNKTSRPMWIVQQVCQYSFVGLMIIFAFLGARAYADDVAFIEGEMVTMAKWIASNTPETALIASHDIGAIGYFAERPLLDLAGLITPDIIPLLDDEQAMTNYIITSKAEYLVTAPGWPYASIIKISQSQHIFSTKHQWTVENGQNNMTIYLLQGS